MASRAPGASNSLPRLLTIAGGALAQAFAEPDTSTGRALLWLDATVTVLLALLMASESSTRLRIAAAIMAAALFIVVAVTGAGLGTRDSSKPSAIRWLVAVLSYGAKLALLASLLNIRVTKSIAGPRPLMHDRLQRYLAPHEYAEWQRTGDVPDRKRADAVWLLTDAATYRDMCPYSYEDIKKVADNILRIYNDDNNRLQNDAINKLTNCSMQINHSGIIRDIIADIDRSNAPEEKMKEILMCLYAYGLLMHGHADYIQSFGHPAAFLLCLFEKDPRRAFWCFVTLFESPFYNLRSLMIDGIVAFCAQPYSTILNPGICMNAQYSCSTLNVLLLSAFGRSFSSALLCQIVRELQARHPFSSQSRQPLDQYLQMIADFTRQLNTDSEQTILGKMIRGAFQDPLAHRHVFSALKEQTLDGPSPSPFHPLDVKARLLECIAETERVLASHGIFTDRAPENRPNWGPLDTCFIDKTSKKWHATSLRDVYCIRDINLEKHILPFMRDKLRNPENLAATVLRLGTVDYRLRHTKDEWTFEVRFSETPYLRPVLTDSLLDEILPKRLWFDNNIPPLNSKYDRFAQLYPYLDVVTAKGGESPYQLLNKAMKQKFSDRPLQDVQTLEDVLKEIANSLTTEQRPEDIRMFRSHSGYMVCVVEQPRRTTLTLRVPKGIANELQIKEEKEEGTEEEKEEETEEEEEELDVGRAGAPAGS